MPDDPVVAAIAETWPELGGTTPPSRSALAERLARTCPQWSLTAPDPALRYEDAIAAGLIPTRERSWHDAFNVHAFVMFPRAKAALHARMRALPVHAGRRPREGDALALLDETVLVLACPSTAMAALADARARESIDAIDRIVRAERIAVRCFGHALLEHRKLARPPIGCGVVAIAVAQPDGATIDAALADAITAGAFARPCFSPTLPWPDPQVDAWVLRAL